MLLTEALREFDPRLLSFSEGRRELTKNDPLLFAAVYLPHKLKFQASESISLNPFHLDLLEYAKVWTQPLSKPKAHRDCFIAPRQCGKSTWLFHILPIWAGAHGHKKYVLAFSDSDTQAQGWLLNFKTELDSNALLQQDFPEFCDIHKSTNVGRALMDNRNATKRANGFIFQARGADSAVLGANVDGLRPEVLLFDDIEPSESNYSALEAEKRLKTLQQSHFYLNVFGIVAIVGTTTMPGSIIDQIRKVGQAKDDYDGPPEMFRESLDPSLRWVVDENIQSRYWPAIVTDEAGAESSLWPEVWPMEQMEQDRHTRSFAMNMMNKPLSLDGGYWEESDLDLDEPEEYGNTILTVDPAVTTKKKSDYTGIAVISRGSDRRIYVRHAEQVKLASDDLRDHVAAVAERYGAGLILVEHNQGGDLWKQVFHDMPCRVRLQRAGLAKKEVRAAQAFDHYRKGEVKHTRHFPVLEEQMLAFPKVQHDDVVDAVVTGVLYFKNSTGSKVVAKQIRYQEV